MTDSYNVGYSVDALGDLREIYSYIANELKVEIPQYSKELFNAADEAKHISHDPDVPGYTSIEALKKALEI